MSLLSQGPAVGQKISPPPSPTPTPPFPHPDLPTPSQDMCARMLIAPSCSADPLSGLRLAFSPLLSWVRSPTAQLRISYNPPPPPFRTPFHSSIIGMPCPVGSQIIVEDDHRLYVFHTCKGTLDRMSSGPIKVCIRLCLIRVFTNDSRVIQCV